MIDEIKKHRKRTEESKCMDIMFLKMQKEKRQGCLGISDTCFKKSAKRSEKKKIKSESSEKILDATYSSEGDVSDFSLSPECLESVTSESNDDSHEKEQSLLLPKDILKRTALTAVGEGLSINQHTANQLTDSKYKLISVHFDGKIFKKYTDKVSVTRERLAVLVKVNGKTELLGIPHIESGSGENQFKAVYNLLDSLGLSHHIQ
ncbi:uncharacterized protein LOC124817872 [Hydra vulgaris]|uniref:uncharacterized protein LOC124817872 n=1 Tax=Hydra vulgaris TaxID=6087 RepID=UPI001F5FECC6|nr:uncharacterized protein LOC124817872 [Hydra vulgaris]